MKYRCLSHSRRGRGNKSSGLQNIKRQLYCLFLASKHAHARSKVSPRVRALLRAWKNTIERGKRERNQMRTNGIVRGLRQEATLRRRREEEKCV